MSHPPENRGARPESNRDLAVRPTAPVSAWHRSAARQIRIPPSIYDAPGTGNASFMSVGPLSARNSRESGSLLSPERHLPLRSARASDKRPFSHRLGDPPGGSASHIRNTHSMEAAERVGTTSTRAREAARQRLRESSVHSGHKSSSSDASVRRDASGSDSEHVGSGVKLRSEVFPSRLPLHSDFHSVYGGGFKTRSRSAVTSPVDIVQPARLSTSPPIPEHGTVSFAEGFPTTAPGASPDDHAPGNKGVRGRTSGKVVVPIPLMTPDELDDVMPVASSAVLHSTATATRNASKSPKSPPSRASPTLSPHTHSRSPVALSVHVPPKLDVEGLVVIGSHVSISPEPVRATSKPEPSSTHGEIEAHWMARVARCRSQLEALRFALPAKSSLPSPSNVANSSSTPAARRGRTGGSLRLNLPVRRADSDKSVVSFGGVLEDAVAAFSAVETAVLAAETAQLTCFSSPVITSPPVAASKPVGPHPPPRHANERVRPVIRGRPIRRSHELSSAHPRHHSPSPAGFQALQAAVVTCESAIEKLSAMLSSVHVSSVTATSAVDSDGGSGVEDKLKAPFIPQTPRNKPHSVQGQREGQSSTVNVGPSRLAGSDTPVSADGGDTDGQVAVSTAPSTPKAKPQPLAHVTASPHSSHRVPPATPRSSVARIRATYSGVSKSAVTSPVASVSAASPMDPRPSSKGTLQRSSSSHSESKSRPQAGAASPIIPAVITTESLKQRAVTWLTRLSNAQSVLESVITAATMSDAVKIGNSGHDLRTVLVRAVTSLQETVEAAIAQLNAEDTQLIVLEGSASPVVTPGHSPAPVTASGRSTPHTNFDASIAITVGGSPHHGGQSFAVHRPPAIVVDPFHLRDASSEVDMPGGNTLPLESILQANEVTVSSIEQQCMSLQRIADMHTTVTLCKQQVEVTQSAIAQAELAQTKAVSEFANSRTMADSQTMTGATPSAAQSASLRSLSSTVTHAHAQSGLLVQLSPYWARLAAIRARSCDLVAQLGPLCGVHVPLDVTLQKAPESPSEPIALVVSADVDIAEDSLAYEALDSAIPRILRSIRSALTAAAQCETSLLTILNDKSLQVGEEFDETFTTRAVNAALRFSKEVDGAESAVDVLSAFVDAWPAMFDASERIQHLRRRVNAGHLASLSEATASSAKHSLTTAKMAVANAEKSFVSLLRSLSSGKRHGSGSGAFVRGLRALFSAQARTNPVSPQRFASSITAGRANPTMATLLVPKQSPALQTLMINVKKAESIVSQALNSSVRPTHRRKDDEAALLAKLQEYTHRLVGVIVCFKGLGIVSWPRLLALPLKSKFQACFEAIRVANEAWQSDDGTPTSGTPNTSKSSGRSSFVARRQLVNMAGMELRVLERGVVEAKSSLVHSKRTRPQLDRRLSLAQAVSVPVAAEVTTEDILPSPKLAGKWFTDLFTAVTAMDNDMSGFVSTVGQEDASLPRFPSFVGEEVAALSASMSLERQRTWSEGSLASVALFGRQTMSTNVSGQNGSENLKVPHGSPLLAGTHADDQSHALPFTSSEHFSSSNGTVTVSGGSNSGTSAAPGSDVQSASLQQHQPAIASTPTPPAPQAVAPPRRYGRRFAIDLTAALKRSLSMDESRLHAWQAVMSPKASVHDVLSPAGGDGKPLKRRGSGRRYRTRPGSVVSLQSTTPYGKAQGPLDSEFDTGSSGSDGEGGGQTRSYGSRSTLSVVSGSTITSRQRRRYTSRSHRTSDGSSGRDRVAIARPRNPDGRSSDSESDRGSRRQHRHRSASQRQRQRNNGDDTRSVRDSRHHSFFP